MKRPRTRVSDHAVVRYLQRVGGFDVERLKREIAQRGDDAARAGASAVIVNGVHFMIGRDETGLPVVTTVIDPKVDGPLPARTLRRRP